MQIYHASRESFLYLKDFYIGELSPQASMGQERGGGEGRGGLQPQRRGGSRGGGACSHRSREGGVEVAGPAAT